MKKFLFGCLLSCLLFLGTAVKGMDKDPMKLDAQDGLYSFTKENHKSIADLYGDLKKIKETLRGTLMHCFVYRCKDWLQAIAEDIGTLKASSSQNIALRREIAKLERTHAILLEFFNKNHGQHIVLFENINNYIVEMKELIADSSDFDQRTEKEQENILVGDILGNICVIATLLDKPLQKDIIVYVKDQVFHFVDKLIETYTSRITLKHSIKTLIMMKRRVDSDSLEDTISHLETYQNYYSSLLKEYEKLEKLSSIAQQNYFYFAHSLFLFNEAFKKELDSLYEAIQALNRSIHRYN